MLLNGEPVGQGTYRLSEHWPWVIDVPAGLTIVYRGQVINEPDASSADAPESTLVLKDVGTGSVLHIDPRTGRAGPAYITAPHVSDLFDHLIASIRRQ